MSQRSARDNSNRFSSLELWLKPSNEMHICNNIHTGYIHPETECQTNVYIVHKPRRIFSVSICILWNGNSFVNKGADWEKNVFPSFQISAIRCVCVCKRYSGRMSLCGCAEGNWSKHRAYMPVFKLPHPSRSREWRIKKATQYRQRRGTITNKWNCNGKELPKTPI